MQKVTERFLLDEFSASGTELQEFIDLCREIDEHTAHCVENIEKFKVFSIRPGAREEAEFTGTYPCWVFEPSDPINKGILKEGTFDISWYRDKGYGFLTDEAEETGLILRSDLGENVFVSVNAFNTFAQRIDCDARTMCHKNVGRDILLAERIGQEAKEATFVFKTVNGIKKLFSVMSSKYAQIPMLTISEVVANLSQTNQLGKGVCLGWSIDHKKAVIDYEFPEYVEDIKKIYHLPKPMIPCVKLMTSDIGECSVVAKGYWKLGNNIIPDAEFSKEHKGALDSEKIIKGIEDKVFFNYTKLPDKLAKAMLISVTDPNAALQTESDREANRQQILKLYKELFEMISMKEILGPRRMQELIDCIEYAYIDDSMHYTAYDVMMDMLELPEQLKAYLYDQEIGETTYKKLQAAVAKVPTFDFNKLINSEKVYLRQTA